MLRLDWIIREKPIPKWKQQATVAGGDTKALLYSDPPFQGKHEHG